MAAERDTKGECFGHSQPCALDRLTLILSGLRPATETQSLTLYRLLMIGTSGCTWGAFPEARVPT